MLSLSTFESGKVGCRPDTSTVMFPGMEGADDLPPSLRRAVYAFILSCAGRRVRGHSGKHNSMLVHVTRYTVVQHAVFSQVERLLQQLRQRIVRGEGALTATTVSDLRQMWEQDFLPTTAAGQEANR